MKNGIIPVCSFSSQSISKRTFSSVVLPTPGFPSRMILEKDIIAALNVISFSSLINEVISVPSYLVMYLFS